MGSVNHIKPKMIKKALSRLEGFTLHSIGRTARCHYECLITDDAGNTFKLCTGSTCSSDARRALLNFRTDVKRHSNRLKGLID